MYMAHRHQEDHPTATTLTCVITLTITTRALSTSAKDTPYISWDNSLLSYLMRLPGCYISLHLYTCNQQSSTKLPLLEAWHHGRSSVADPKAARQKSQVCTDSGPSFSERLIPAPKRGTWNRHEPYGFKPVWRIPAATSFMDQLGPFPLATTCWVSTQILGGERHLHPQVLRFLDYLEACPIDYWRPAKLEGELLSYDLMTLYVGYLENQKLTRHLTTKMSFRYEIVK